MIRRSRRDPQSPEGGRAVSIADKLMEQWDRYLADLMRDHAEYCSRLDALCAIKEAEDFNQSPRGPEVANNASGEQR